MTINNQNNHKQQQPSNHSRVSQKGTNPFSRAPSFGSPRFTFGHFETHTNTLNL